MSVRWAEAVPKTNGGVDVPAAVAEDEPEEAVEEREAGEEAGMVAAEEEESSAMGETWGH